MEDIRVNSKMIFHIDNPGFVSVERNKDYTFEFKDGKEVLSFIYVENGSLEYSFKGMQHNIVIDKGCMLYVPPHLPYKTRYMENRTIIKIIMFDICSDELPEHLAAPFTKKSADIAAVISTLSNEKLYDTLFLTAKAYELLYITSTETLEVPKKYKRIIPVINEIKSKFYENHTLEYYSDMCTMSESNFRKLFKEYTGKSPIEYRNHIRIFEAKRMIDSGEFSVSEAAYMTGFNNMSFFYELYNRMMK